jgi:hypothetical protein
MFSSKENSKEWNKCTKPNLANLQTLNRKVV